MLCLKCFVHVCLPALPEKTTLLVYEQKIGSCEGCAREGIPACAERAGTNERTNEGSGHGRGARSGRDGASPLLVLRGRVVARFKVEVDKGALDLVQALDLFLKRLANVVRLLQQLCGHKGGEGVQGR